MFLQTHPSHSSASTREGLQTWRGTQKWSLSVSFQVVFSKLFTGKEEGWCSEFAEPQLSLRSTNTGMCFQSTKAGQQMHQGSPAGALGPGVPLGAWQGWGCRAGQPGHTAAVPESQQTLSEMQQELQRRWGKVGNLWGKPICLLLQGLPPSSHFPSFCL